MKAALQFYKGTTAEWENLNPRPYDATLCIENRADGSRLLKIGNGQDRWNDLEYVDETYIEGLPEALEETAAFITDEIARAMNAEASLQANINAEENRALGVEQGLQASINYESSRAQDAEQAAQEVADAALAAAEAAAGEASAENIVSGALGGDTDDLKLTFAKADQSTVEVPLTALKDLFLRRQAQNANGATAIGNDPEADGFSAVSEKTGANSVGGLVTSAAAENPAAAGMYLAHKVNPTDSVRILLMNNGTTKRAYLLKDKAVPVAVGDISGDDELWNKKEILDQINNAIAGLSSGLKLPISLDLESGLPDPATAEAGDYYRIADMDITAPGESGEAWYNPDVAADAWQKTVNAYFVPDNETIGLNSDGKVAINPDLVALIDGSLQAGEGTPPFTYLVDSDAKLADWANNVKTGGQDYTAVLIAPGTWTSATRVNLSMAGTKHVAGMPGSKLVFTSQFGLTYDALPTSKDYHMENVTVETTNSAPLIRAFTNCTNLTGCTATVTGNGNGYGFSACKGMILNEGSGTIGAYDPNCYVSRSGTGAAPADTAAGGWNRAA